MKAASRTASSGFIALLFYDSSAHLCLCHPPAEGLTETGAMQVFAPFSGAGLVQALKFGVFFTAGGRSASRKKQEETFWFLLLNGLNE